MLETKLKDELVQLLVFFAAALAIFKIMFFKEDLITVLKVVSAFFYTFIIPGYAIIYYWSGKFDFIERLVIGTVLGMALFGIVSYYTGLLGFGIKYQSFIIPAVFILAGAALYYLKLKGKK